MKNNALISPGSISRAGVTSVLWVYFMLPLEVLMALPSGESVTHGSATFERSGNSLVIRQGSDKLITKWDSFSISQGNRTEFIQPTKNSAALNRVVGGSRSIIDGELKANGKVILINPAGVTVGPTGVVNVNSFTASTQDITDQEFIGGGELLYKGASEETIENHGRITAAGGDAIIIAKHIKNYGEINAANGTVALAAGTEVLVKPVGEERVSIRPGSQKGGTIEQSVAGRVKAAAAEIKAAGNPYALAINLDGLIDTKGTANTRGRVAVAGGNTKLAATGTIKSRTVTGAGGEVTITNSKTEDRNGKIEIAGRVDAAGESDDGGQIAFRASLVELKTGSLLDASSLTGNGGRITVGGEFQGGIDPITHADGVVVEAGALLKANAGTIGNGGTVIIWSDKNTFFSGAIEARGGTESGNGGFAEISGKEYLSFSGGADLSAVNGELGTVLLDPSDITITAGAVTPIIPTSANTYDPVGASSTITWADINSISAANVLIRTASGAGGQGDITILDGGIWAGSGTLTFEAFRDININIASSATSKIIGASNVSGSFAFLAGRDFNMSGVTGANRDAGVVIRSSAANVVGNTGSITVQTGLVTAGGSFNHTGGSLLTHNGNISIQALNGGNIFIGNSTQANSQIMAGYVTTTYNGLGSLTLNAPAGSITINQSLSSTTARAVSAGGLAVPIETFVVGGYRKLTMQTGASDAGFTLNRDITIWLRNGSVIQSEGGLGNAAVGIVINSGRDLFIQATGETYGQQTISASPGANDASASGLVGHIHTTAFNYDITTARNLSLGEYDDGDPMTPPAVRPVGAIAAGLGSVLNITVGGNFYEAGGTTQTFTIAGGAVNQTNSGSRIVGGGSVGGSVLNFNVTGDFNMTNAAAIAQFARINLTIGGNVTLDQNAIIASMGGPLPTGFTDYGQAWQVGGSFTMNTGTGLESSNSVGGISVIAQGAITLQNDTTNAPRLLTSAAAGPIYLQSVTNSVNVHGGNILATYSASAGSGGNITLIAQQNVNLNSGGLIRGLSGSVPDRQILIRSEFGSINLDSFTISNGELLPLLTPTLVSGITLQAGDTGVGGMQDVNLHNYSIVGNQITIIGDSVTSQAGAGHIQTGGDLVQITSRVGDITFNSTGRVRSDGFASGAGTKGINFTSAQDIRIQPNTGLLQFDGGQNLVSGAPTTNDAPFTFTANRDIILGGSTGVFTFGGTGAANHSTQDITFDAGNSIFVNNRVGGGNSSRNVIQTTSTGKINFLAQNAVTWDGSTPSATNLRSTVQTTNGEIVIRTVTGSVNLGYISTTTGNITIAAGTYLPPGVGPQSIFDAYGPRLPSSAQDVNIQTNSGTVALTALGTIGVGNALNPISTQLDLKFNLGSDAKITASSNGTGVTDGAFLYSFNDLIIGIPASAGITAQGDIVLKSNGNLFVNGDVVTGGSGRTIGLRSNAIGTNAVKGRSGDFTANATLAGDIIISGSIATANGNIFLETGSETINDSFNSIRYNPLVTEAIDAGTANITFRSNNDIALGRVVTDGGNVTITAGFITNYAAYLTGAVATVQNDAGKIYDAYPRELRDSTDQLTAGDNANIQVIPAIGFPGTPEVTLVGGLSVGQLPNGQDLDLALGTTVQLIVHGNGTTAANGDGVFLSFLGDFSTNSTTSLITSGSNLSLSVTGDLTVATGSALTTANNGNIWLTAYGTFSPTAGNLTVNAGVNAHGTGNINILGIGLVLINHTLQTATGDISIIGAGRGQTYGVDVTASGVVTTGGGTIHLASLASAEALNATVTTDVTYGRIRVGDVVITGEAETTVDQAGTYFRGVTYGDEVVYNSNGVITGTAGSTATTSQLATLVGATGTVQYTVTNAGIVIIDTTGSAGSPALTSTSPIGVNTVTVTDATTSIYGNATAEADTTTGTTGTQVTALTGGSTTITGGGLSFSLTSAGAASILATSGTTVTTLTANGSNFSVGSGDVSGTGVNATILSAAGATSSVTTSSNGTVTNSNYVATGVTTSIIAGNTSTDNIASGNFTAGGVGIPVTVSLDSGQTTVSSSQAVAISIQPGGDVDLTYSGALANTANIATTNGATIGYLIVPVTSVVFEATTAPTLSLASDLTTLALAGGARAQVATNSLVATGTGSGFSNASNVAYNVNNGVVEVGLTTALTTAAVNTLAQSGTGVPTEPVLTFDGNTGANVTLAAGLDLTFNSTAPNGFSTSTVVGGVSAIGASANASVVQNNVRINGTTVGITTGNGITGTNSGTAANNVIEVALTQNSASIFLDGATVTAQNTPNTSDPTMWTDLGNGTFQYAKTNISIGGAGTTIQNGNAAVNLAASTLGTPVAANGATLIYNPGTGTFTISAISLASGTYDPTVNLKARVSIAGTTTTSTGGNALVGNITTSQNYTTLGLHSAGIAASSVGASFAGVNLSTTNATVSTSQLVTTNGITSANVSGGTSTFANEIRTKAGNTLDMVAGAGGMEVSAGGTLVNINGIATYSNTNPLNKSSLRIQNGATITSGGGDIYTSGYQNAEIATLNAAGASNGGNGGNVFLEATEGIVSDLATGTTVNVIGNQATINGGNGLYGLFTPTGGVGIPGVGNAIKLNVQSLNFSAGGGGANFEMAQNRALPIAGQSQGQVAVLNDHAVSRRQV